MSVFPGVGSEALRSRYPPTRDRTVPPPHWLPSTPDMLARTRDSSILSMARRSCPQRPMRDGLRLVELGKAPLRERDSLLGSVDADETSTERCRCDERRAGTAEVVGDHVPGV